MSARCPQCRYLVAQPGLCAVCQSRVPVQVVTDVASVQVPVMPFGRTTQPPPPPRTLHCQEPSCEQAVQVDPRGLAIIRKRGVLVRCEACRVAHQRQQTRDYHRQHRAAIGRKEVRMG